MAKNSRQKDKMIPKKVTLITPPDILPNRTQSILLITPSSDIKDFLDHYLKTFNANIHVYLYDQGTGDLF